MKAAIASTLSALILAFAIPAFGLGVGDYAGPDAATVKAHLDKHGLGKWEAFTFLEVDGEQVSGLRAQDMFSSTLHLRPGDHNIAILYQSPRGFLRGFWTADILLRANLKAQGRYSLGGSRSGDRIKAWIEDLDTHEKVSTIIAASGPILRKREDTARTPDDPTDSPKP